MERPRIDLVATTDAAGTVTPSSAELIPSGFDVFSAQAVYNFTNYNGGTVTAQLQGSNDDANPVNWSDIDDAVSTAVAADAVEMLGAGAATPTQILLGGVFKWVRLNLAIGAGPPDAGSVAAALVSPGTVGSGQAST